MARIKKVLDPAPQVSAIDPHGPHTRRWGEGMRHTHDFYTNTVGRAMGYVTNFYGKVVENEAVSRVTNGILQKGWRVLLFTNRAGLTHRIKQGSVEDFNQTPIVTGSLNAFKGPQRAEYFSTLLHQAFNDQYELTGHKPKLLFGHQLPLITANGDKLDALVDLLNKTTDPAEIQAENQVIIYNVLSEEIDRIVLQIRPNTIEMKPETSWADIKSMGRNTPMYHYLGASQELHINTSWFLSKSPQDPGFNPFEVINNCRKLEAWSMANGFYSSPPILQIEWGRGDIFAGQFWILASATYTLRDFHDRVIVNYDSNPHVTEGQDYQANVRGLINSGLIPYSATQELIFRRVADHNLLHTDICPPLQAQSAPSEKA